MRSNTPRHHQHSSLSRKGIREKLISALAKWTISWMRFYSCYAICFRPTCICVTKNSAKDSDGRIYVSHVFMYLLFTRYLNEGLDCSNCNVSAWPRRSRMINRKFWVNNPDKWHRDLICGTSSLPRLRAKSNIYDNNIYNNFRQPKRSKIFKVLTVF